MRFWKLAAAGLIAVAASAGAAKAEDLLIVLKNETGSVLDTFHTSPVGVDEWEDDVLGSQVLAPGESIEITIADGRDVCEYDMRFEFQGDELETTVDTQDLCALGEYTITE